MMVDMSKWEHKDEWHRRGRNFLVVVKHYTVEPSTYDVCDGQHRWNVYGYIYPTHLLFSTFQGPDMWQSAATNLPLHAGPSFLTWHYNNDSVPCSVQIGSDYNHLHDNRFTTFSTPDDAYEVFSDANKLFAFLAASDTDQRNKMK
jgi:hypothetical protein